MSGFDSPFGGPAIGALCKAKLRDPLLFELPLAKNLRPLLLRNHDENVRGDPTRFALCMHRDAVRNVHARHSSEGKRAVTTPAPHEHTTDSRDRIAVVFKLPPHRMAMRTGNGDRSVFPH